MPQMFIPKRIKVGFVKRSDTFTGKLAYIIYYDEKGKLRKESSWNSWRDKDVETFEFDNTPRSGYVFNKGVQRDGYWGSGRSVIRVYDERDFEFEISVDNLMGLLMHSDVSKRDIVEQCIFAWEGTELVLLPVSSKEYVDSVKYTEKQDKKISSKELIEGYTYQAKKSDKPWIYMGYREWFDWVNTYELKGQTTKDTRNYDTDITGYESKGKKHIFYDGNNFFVKTANDISEVLSECADSNYANLVDKFFETVNSQKIVSIEGTKNDEKINKKRNGYSREIYYFIGENYLGFLELRRESDGKGNGYSIKPGLAILVSFLRYESSLKLENPYYNNQSITKIPKLNEIKDKFNQVFSTYIRGKDADKIQEEFEKVQQQARDWLLQYGLYEGYSYVLENGKKVKKC